MVNIIGALIGGNPIAGGGSGVPSTAVLYEDTSPVKYEDTTFVLYEIS